LILIVCLLLSILLISVISFSIFGIPLDDNFTSAAASTGGGCDIVIMLPPELKDADGNFISSAHLDDPVLISTIFANCTDEEIPFTVVIEVRDEDDVTLYLQFQSGRLDAKADSELSLAWTPEKPGKYELRTFALSDLTLPQIYSQIWFSNVTIS